MVTRSSVVVLLVVGAACGRQGPSVDARSLPLEAYCTAAVEGVGALDVETDYLPHVVTCENGAASLEALKVQAVSARSYLYYRLETAGVIGDGQSDQVYTCGQEPGPDQIAAVEATSGQYLSFAGDVTAAFYVAGGLGDPPGCVGDGDDPTNTERFVTYNEGRTAEDVIQTSLGWVDPANTRNRGCMSQNGAHCLSDDGWGHDDILRFYYGADIQLGQAVGDCVVPGADGDADSDADTDADTDSDADVDIDADADTDADADADADLDADADADLDDGERGADAGCAVVPATRADARGLGLVAVLLYWSWKKTRFCSPGASRTLLRKR